MEYLILLVVLIWTLFYAALWLFGAGIVILVCIAVGVIALRIIQWGLSGLGGRSHKPSTGPTYITPTQFLEKSKS